MNNISVVRGYRKNMDTTWRWETKKLATNRTGWHQHVAKCTGCAL